MINTLGRIYVQSVNVWVLTH